MVKSFQKRHEMGNIEVARNDVFEICLFEWIDSVVREIYEHRLKELYALKPPPNFYRVPTTDYLPIFKLGQN